MRSPLRSSSSRAAGRSGASSKWVWGGLAVALSSALLLWAAGAFAHPLLQDALRVELGDELEITIRASLRSAVLTSGAKPASGSFFTRQEVDRAIAAHAGYLLRHLRVRADERLLDGRVEFASLSEAPGPIHATLDLERAFALYRFGYGAFPPGARLSLEQNVLADSAAADSTPGKPWVETFAVTLTSARQPARGVLARGLLTWEEGFDFDTRADGRDARSIHDGQSRAGARPNGTFFSYLELGVFHILRGWDHLLFVAALTLGARRLGELVKLVLAFTLAHSVTLTLAVLGWVALPAWLVEPTIALSIVVVSLGNVFRSVASSGALRLATAFGFGLVHGLGFAGPLIEALRGAPSVEIARGILGFSSGVELGHQLVVIPLFALLTLARRRDMQRASAWTLRYGSLVTALGGAFFLVHALATP